MKQKGITLVALVITVVVLLILAGTAISIAINGGDIFGKAATARESWNSAVAEEQTQVDDVIGVLNTAVTINGGEQTATPTPTETATPTPTQTATPTPTPVGITMTLKANNESTGTQVIVTQANFAEHLGKIVTNYTGAATSVNSMTVSNTYRLFWIDWENKYGDGAGTIYLKADCTSNKYSLTLEPTDATIDPENSNIRKLNPEMYKTGKTQPAVNSKNMKAVRWLTNANNWSGLINSTYSAKTNYVIGTPSLEMFIDSYNAHYGLTNGTMDTGTRDSSSTRTKLDYIYPLNSNNYGYGVGPSNQSSAINGYYTNTSNYTVQTDSTIDSMYYPGSGNSYWLASPSADRTNYVMLVRGSGGGYVYTYNYYTSRAVCPLVSLQSDVLL